jgi:hypothetical protein
MNTCPDCGERLIKYDEYTVRCRNGHFHKLGEPPKKPRRWPFAAGASAATLALDLLVRTIA